MISSQSWSWMCFASVWGLWSLGKCSAQNRGVVKLKDWSKKFWLAQFTSSSNLILIAFNIYSIWFWFIIGSLPSVHPFWCNVIVHVAVEPVWWTYYLLVLSGTVVHVVIAIVHDSLACARGADHVQTNLVHAPPASPSWNGAPASCSWSNLVQIYLLFGSFLVWWRWCMSRSCTICLFSNWYKLQLVQSLWHRSPAFSYIWFCHPLAQG